MPRQNRVTPFGTLIAVDARGTLMGNRGRLHDDDGLIRRLYQGKRWIACRLEFKGRRRTIMAPGQYTELFFLDEATAFAAGHRPCAECRRDRFELFRQAWVRASLPGSESGRPAAPEIDDALHGERLLDRRKRTFLAGLGSLPDGTFVAGEGEDEAFLVLSGRLLRWSPWGYLAGPGPRALDTLRVLTPRPLVAVLAAGYLPDIHPSAFEPRRTG